MPLPTRSLRKNRGYLGSDSSALSTQDLQVSIANPGGRRPLTGDGANKFTSGFRTAINCAMNWTSILGTSASGV